LQQLARLHRHTLVILLLTALGYAVVVAVEAVGLWRRRGRGRSVTIPGRRSASIPVGYEPGRAA
jgi:uncharacterized membrane protein (DUF2068 family)